MSDLAVVNLDTGEVIDRPRSAEQWATVVRRDLAGAVEGVIAAGRHLLEAKESVAHGEFGHVVTEARISMSTAQYLMRIAEHPVLSNAQHVGHLPPSWGTLAELARASQAAVERILLIEGWTIVDRHWRHPVVDVEIDFVAVSPVGKTCWIECKGSWESERNGLERADTTKKAIGSAAMLKMLDDPAPYILITSHVPTSGAALTWLRLAEGIYFDQIRVVGSSQPRIQ